MAPSPPSSALVCSSAATVTRATARLARCLSRFRCPSPPHAVRTVRAVRERARARRPAREQQTAGGGRRAGAGGAEEGGGGHGRASPQPRTVLPLLLSRDRAAPAGEAQAEGGGHCLGPRRVGARTGN